MASYATNRVFRVLVPGTAASGVASGIGNVANGELAVIKRDGSLASASDVLNYHLNGDKVQIIIGGTSAFVRQKTDFFSPKDITKYDKQSYAAEVQKVITVNYSAVASIVANYEYTIIINETSDHEILQNRQARKQYTYVANAGDTFDTVATNLTAQINADTYAPVSASYATPVLTLTAKVLTQYITTDFRDQINFEVNSKVTQSGLTNAGYNNYYSQYGVITNTVPIGYGEGTYRQIYTLERMSQGYKGVTNYTKFPIETGEYFSVAGGTYDTRVLEFNNSHETNNETLGTKQSPQTYIFAFPTAASTTTAAFDAIFGQAGIGSSTIDDA